jgi:phage shock protein PspC (stress-responsive transcriptional regulator)
MSMPSNRWVDRTQPQTLMMATVLMYINAALGVLFGVAFVSPLLAILVLGPVAAGWGIANEKKWGYWLGLSLTLVEVLYLLLHFWYGSVITLLFYIALTALLLHPESRSYRRTWFR